MICSSFFQWSLPLETQSPRLPLRSYRDFAPERRVTINHWLNWNMNWRKYINNNLSKQTALFACLILPPSLPPTSASHSRDSTRRIPHWWRSSIAYLIDCCSILNFCARSRKKPAIFVKQLNALTIRILHTPVPERKGNIALDCKTVRILARVLWANYRCFAPPDSREREKKRLFCSLTSRLYYASLENHAVACNG